MGDTMDKKFVTRNLKPYKTLRKFTKKGGLKKLKGKNFAELEGMAAKAVLKKGKIKSKPLDATVNKAKFKKKVMRRAKRRLSNIAQAYRPGSTSVIKNKKVRRAANHLRQIRRNRRVNKTPVGSAAAYDIYKGYRR